MKMKMKTKRRRGSVRIYIFFSLADYDGQRTLCTTLRASKFRIGGSVEYFSYLLLRRQDGKNKSWQNVRKMCICSLHEPWMQVSMKLVATGKVNGSKKSTAHCSHALPKRYKK